MSWFHPKSLIDDLFEIGIVIKGIDGALEMLGGLLLWLVHPALVNSWIQRLTLHELAEHPQITLWPKVLSYESTHVYKGIAVFAVIYLLGHGLVKLGIAISLLRTLKYAYQFALGGMAVLIAIELFRLGTHFTIILTVFTLFDFVVTYLIWREWRQYKAQLTHEQ